MGLILAVSLLTSSTIAQPLFFPAAAPVLAAAAVAAGTTAGATVASATAAGVAAAGASSAAVGVAEAAAALAAVGAAAPAAIPVTTLLAGKALAVGVIGGKLALAHVLLNNQSE